MSSPSSTTPASSATPPPPHIDLPPPHPGVSGRSRPRSDTDGAWSAVGCRSLDVAHLSPISTDCLAIDSLHLLAELADPRGPHPPPPLAPVRRRRRRARQRPATWATEFPDPDEVADLADRLRQARGPTLAWAEGAGARLSIKGGRPTPSAPWANPARPTVGLGQPHRYRGLRSWCLSPKGRTNPQVGRRVAGWAS